MFIFGVLQAHKKAIILCPKVEAVPQLGFRSTISYRLSAL